MQMNELMNDVCDYMLLMHLLSFIFQIPA